MFGNGLVRRAGSYCQAHHVFDDSVKFIGQAGLKVSYVPDQLITKTRLFKYIENFTTIKIENFQIKKS